MIPARRTLPRPPSDRCQQLFNLLLDVNKTNNIGATLRVAGGWVRDQLLGIDAHDVDIAIETPSAASDPSLPAPQLITGEVFAHQIAAYQKAKSLELSTISVVRTNPEKSKHIETAQMSLCGLPVEFCHLRADDYCAETRIPIIRPGTPREDALRRDFTVNALFYNLHSMEVEDFTGPLVDEGRRVFPGQGFEDMQNKVLRCPLAPLETFTDDPLRLLRGVRFCGQLGYDLDPTVLNCVKEHGNKIIPAIQQKLSRERIGIEVTKMFGGKDPTRCLALLHETKLLYTTLMVEHYYVIMKGDKIQIGGPTKGCPSPTRVEYTLSTPEAVMYLSAEGGDASTPSATAVMPVLEEDFQKMSTNVVRQGTAWLSAVASVVAIPLGEARMACSFYSFMPLMLRGPSFPDTLIPNPKSRNEIHRYRINAILTHSMKLPLRVSNALGRMMESGDLLTPHWTTLVAAATQFQSQPQQQEGATPLVFVGPSREALFFALKGLKDENPCLIDVVFAFQCMVLTDGAEGWVPMYQAFKAALKADTGLTQLVTVGPRLKGNMLTKALGVANKEIGRMLEIEQAFLIHNPNAADEDILQHLQAAKTEAS